MAGAALILPCLGRTEIDIQAAGPQSITVEDSMSMVHASGGRNKPASEHLLSEVAIVAGLAKATLGDRTVVEWDRFVADYDLHPRRDRGRLSDLPGLQRAHPRARRLPSDLDRPGAHLGDAVRQGQFPGVRGRRRGSAAERSRLPVAHHDPQPRPVQHHDLLDVRPLSRRLRPARRGLPQRVRDGEARARRTATASI